MGDFFWGVFFLLLVLTLVIPKHMEITLDGHKHTFEWGMNEKDKKNE